MVRTVQRSCRMALHDAPAPDAGKPRIDAHRLRDAAHAASAIGEWLLRAQKLVPLRDQVAFLSPPIIAAKLLRYALRPAGHEPSDDPSARDPEFVRFLLDFFRAVGKTYFRFEARGTENIPRTGPALLVGNHNGALLPTDSFLTAVAIYDALGPERAMYSLAHDFLFEDPTFRRYALKVGALRAGHESAHRAFALGGLVLVYPGSDLDTFRSFRQRGRVVLGGRKGFVKLALHERVPIVPVVSAGTHEQLVVLTRGDRAGRLLHMHAFARTDVFPIVLSSPWGLTSGFLPYLPLPAQTTIAFGPPMAWPELGPEAADDPEVLERVYTDVEAAMQGMLDDLSRGRRLFLGQRRAHA